MTRSFASSAPFAALLNRLPPRLLLAATFLIYVAFAFWFALLPNFAATPVLDVRSFAPAPAFGLLYGLLLLVLFGILILLYRQAYTGRYTPGLGELLVVTAVLGAPLLLTYPINANDIFRYVIRGRISSVYGANPFTLAPADFPGDLYEAYAGEWRAATSPYGPLWESTAALLTRLAGDDLLLALLLFKLLGLLAVLAAGWLIWMTLGDETTAPRRRAFTLLWVWNPAILLTAVANGHNDVLMLAALLLGWLVTRRGNPGPGMVVAVLGPLIKPIALLALPLMFIDTWRSLEGARRRQTALLLWALVGGGLLALLAFLPFGSPAVLLPRLVAEASGGSGFAPATLVFLLAERIDWRVSFRGIAALLPLLYLVYYLWLLWQAGHGRSALAAIPRAFYVYLLQALNFRIWYASWPFPWLILNAAAGTDRARQGLEAGVWFLLTSQLSVLIYGHLLFAFFDGNPFLSHLVGVPFTFVLPLLLAGFLRFTPRLLQPQPPSN